MSTLSGSRARLKGPQVSQVMPTATPFREIAVGARRWLLAAACLGLVALAFLASAGRPALGSLLRTGSVQASFKPGSVTFISLQTGWVLGTAPCASGRECLALRETNDAGRAWSARPLPASLVVAADRLVGGVPGAVYGMAGLNVRFADRSDGWIYGSLAVTTDSYRPTLWSTHDGGLVWREQPLPGLSLDTSIFDLQAAAGTAYRVQSNPLGVTVKSSPVAQDRWRVANTARLGLPAGGAQPSGSIVLQGRSGWLVVGNDRGTSGSARLTPDGQWVSWTPPCASVGGSFAIPAASTPRDLVAVCVMGGFASQPPAGRAEGSSWLYFSNDGGSTFYSGRELGPTGDFFGGVLASPRPGVILIGHGVANGQDLIASSDGGVRWSVVYRGQLLFLGFTSPSQGVGIVKSSSSANTMIMTFDGGHRWAPVKF